jgi:hypothetical protein
MAAELPGVEVQTGKDARAKTMPEIHWKTFVQQNLHAIAAVGPDLIAAEFILSNINAALTRVLETW